MKTNDLKNINTCEQYVINELKKYIRLYEEECKQVFLLQEELDKKNKITPEEDKRDYIYLTNKPYYYYNVVVKSYYNWNEVLKNNKQTPELVEQALTDDEALLKLCSLKSKDYWEKQLGEVKERAYDYLFKDRRGRESVICLDEDSTHFVHIDKEINTFFDKKEAEQFLIEYVRKECNNYFTYGYKEKFYK